MNPNDETAPLAGCQTREKVPRFCIRSECSGNVRRQSWNGGPRGVGIIGWRRREAGRREQTAGLELRPTFAIDV